MKAVWLEAIRLHMEPLSEDTPNVFRLREPFVGVSVILESAKRRPTPFLFATTPRNRGADRITIDASNEHILILQKIKTYFVGGHELAFAHRHCMPWVTISGVTFVERLREGQGNAKDARS